MKKIDFDTDTDFDTDFEKPSPLHQSLLPATEKVIVIGSVPGRGPKGFLPAKTSGEVKSFLRRHQP